MVTWQMDEMIIHSVSVQNDENVNQWLPKESNQKKTCSVGYKGVRWPCLEPLQTESNDSLGVATQTPYSQGLSLI